jgi:hypothetical protein
MIEVLRDRNALTCIGIAIGLSCARRQGRQRVRHSPAPAPGLKLAAHDAIVIHCIPAVHPGPPTPRGHHPCDRLGGLLANEDGRGRHLRPIPRWFRLARFDVQAANAHRATTRTPRGAGPDDATQGFVGAAHVSPTWRTWVRGDGALSAAALCSRPMAGAAVQTLSSTECTCLRTMAATAKVRPRLSSTQKLKLQGSSQKDLSSPLGAPLLLPTAGASVEQHSFAIGLSHAHQLKLDSV